MTLSLWCAMHGYTNNNNFNFPTVEAFKNLLEAHGLIIDEIYDFERPTPLKDGEAGLDNWIRQFYASKFEQVPDKIQKEIIGKGEDITREKLWNGDSWIADYRRLRAIAHL